MTAHAPQRIKDTARRRHILKRVSYFLVLYHLGPLIVSAISVLEQNILLGGLRCLGCPNDSLFSGGQLTVKSTSILISFLIQPMSPPSLFFKSELNVILFLRNRIHLLYALIWYYNFAFLFFISFPWTNSLMSNQAYHKFTLPVRFLEYVKLHCFPHHTLFVVFGTEDRPFKC